MSRNIIFIYDLVSSLLESQLEAGNGRCKSVRVCHDFGYLVLMCYI